MEELEIELTNYWLERIAERERKTEEANRILSSGEEEWEPDL